MNLPRLRYCTHPLSARRSCNRAIISTEMFLETAFEVLRMSDDELLRAIEELASAQPSFVRLTAELGREATQKTWEWFASCGVSVWLTFLRRFPGLNQLANQDLTACVTMRRHFALPEICFCCFRQCELMRFLARDLESQMDRGVLSVSEGTRLVWVAASMVEALDRAAAQMNLAASNRQWLVCRSRQHG